MAGLDPVPKHTVGRSFFGGLRPLLLLVVVGGGILGVLAAILYVTAPDWSRSRPGHPALTGFWGGTMKHGGEARTIVLSLAHDTGQVGNSGVTSDNGVYGTAKVCGPRGTFTDDLSGGVYDNARHVRLSFDWDPPGAGWHPSGLRATWDHQNHLAATTGFVLQHRDGSTGMGNGNPVGHFSLHRISEETFDSGC